MRRRWAGEENASEAVQRLGALATVRCRCFSRCNATAAQPFKCGNTPPRLDRVPPDTAQLVDQSTSTPRNPDHLRIPNFSLPSTFQTAQVVQEKKSSNKFGCAICQVRQERLQGSDLRRGVIENTAVPSPISGGAVQFPLVEPEMG